jgi:hypothetical protein
MKNNPNAMVMLRAVIVLSCVLLLSNVAAQTNYKAGLVVTSTGDTLRGFIDQKEWARNPTSFSFKKNATDAEHQNFDLTTAQYFAVDGDQYVRYAGNISMNANSLKPADVLSPLYSSDPVFLKILVAGKGATLLSYRDHLKVRYFLSTVKGKTDELINRIYPDETQTYQVVVDDRYKQQLLEAAMTAGGLTEHLRWLIKKSSFGGSSLADIVRKINGEKKIRQPLHLFFGGGYNYSMLALSESPIRSVRSTPSGGAFLMAGFNFFPNPRVGRFQIRAEVSVGVTNLHIVSDSAGYYYNNFTSSQFTISLSPQLNYNIYNTENLKFYIGVGVRLNKSFYGNNDFYQSANAPETTTRSVFNYAPLWYSGVLQAGVRIKQKTEISASFNPSPGPFVNDFDLWNQAQNLLRVGLIFHFDVK